MKIIIKETVEMSVMPEGLKRLTVALPIAQSQTKSMQSLIQLVPHKPTLVIKTFSQIRMKCHNEKSTSSTEINYPQSRNSILKFKESLAKLIFPQPQYNNTTILPQPAILF